MKKQIVITLEPALDGWIAEMQGKIGRKKTDILGCFGETRKKCISHITSEQKLNKIEKWMEQIG